MALTRVTSLLAVLLASTLAACQTTAPDQPVSNGSAGGLGGTSWRLVEFQSMDDSQGTTRPDDGSKYTIDFDNEGTVEGNVAVRLDCNRGVGAWTNPIANGTGGTLTFSDLGVTRMLCPPPSMGELLAKQLGYVRSYVIRDGKLYMSLMADGGIIVWELANAKK